MVATMRTRLAVHRPDCGGQITVERFPASVTCGLWHARSMLSIMESMKFSANIPDDLLTFLDQQVSDGRYRSRSAALTEALQAWRVDTLKADYARAFADHDSNWDGVVADGLGEEPPA